MDEASAPRPPVLLLLRPVSVCQTHPRSPGAGTAVSPSSFSNILTWGWLLVGAVVLPQRGGPPPPAEAHAVPGWGAVLPGPWGLRTPPPFLQLWPLGTHCCSTTPEELGLPPQVSP